MISKFYVKQTVKGEDILLPCVYKKYVAQFNCVQHLHIFQQLLLFGCPWSITIYLIMEMNSIATTPNSKILSGLHILSQFILQGLLVRFSGTMEMKTFFFSKWGEGAFH